MHSILIVEDETDIRELVSNGFAKKGFQVFTAENGIRALEVLNSEQIDAVVTDVRMPGGGGIDLLKNIKSSNRITPIVIIMSGFADISKEEVYHLGAAALVAKPFSRQELIETVSNCLIPRAERWKMNPQALVQTQAPVQVQAQPEMQGAIPVQGDFIFKADYQELDRLENGRGILLGHGGIYVGCDSLALQQGATVEFQFRFKVGKMRKLEGSGVVRWVRNSQEGVFPSYGIEFLYLADDIRDGVIRQIEVINPQAFIPAV